MSEEGNEHVCLRVAMKFIKGQCVYLREYVCVHVRV